MAVATKLILIVRIVFRMIHHYCAPGTRRKILHDSLGSSPTAQERFWSTVKLVKSRNGAFCTGRLGWVRRGFAVGWLAWLARLWVGLAWLWVAGTLPVPFPRSRGNMATPTEARLDLLEAFMANQTATILAQSSLIQSQNVSITALESRASQALEAGDTAFLITSTALVLLMTIPGLALFYGGIFNPDLNFPRG